MAGWGLLIGGSTVATQLGSDVHGMIIIVLSQFVPLSVAPFALENKV